MGVIGGIRSHTDICNIGNSTPPIHFTILYEERARQAKLKASQIFEIFFLSLNEWVEWVRKETNNKKKMCCLLIVSHPGATWNSCQYRLKNIRLFVWNRLKENTEEKEMQRKWETVRVRKRERKWEWEGENERETNSEKETDRWRESKKGRKTKWVIGKRV